jgi:acyl carrier protein
LYRRPQRDVRAAGSVLSGKPDKPLMNELQKDILGIWQDYFGYESIGIDDNIFELGGNSLDIAQINEMLKSRLQIEIPLVTLFEYPTIARITEYLKKAAPSDAADKAGERVEEGKSKLSRLRAIARK